MRCCAISFLLLGLLAIVRPAAATLDEVGVEVKDDLAASLTELSALQRLIAEQKVPMVQRLDELEREVLGMRDELAREQRSADNKLVELNALKAVVKSLEEENVYVSERLNEYLRQFETVIHIAEVRLYAEAVESAKAAAGNQDLEFIEKARLQMEILDVSLNRLEALMGGHRFAGQALTASGVMEEGQFAIFGPVAVFSSGASESGGLVQLQLGSPEPTVVDLGASTRSSVREVTQNGQGELPVDASLGNALKIAASEVSLWEHMKQGGPVMVPIVALGLAALLVALIRWIILSGNKLVSPEELQVILDHVRADELGKAKRRIRQVKGVVGDVLTIAVENCREKVDYLEEMLYERMLSARISLQRMLAFIALTAGTAPLLGLLGTVTGMINTFRMITIFGTGDPRMLSGGISEALITTKFGLVVAVPALICHAIVSRKVKGVLGNMEQVTIGFVNCVMNRRKGKGKDKEEEKGKS